MNDPVQLAQYSGIALGILTLLSVLYSYVFHRRYPGGGALLTVFGVMLLGMSIFSKTEFGFSATGGLTAKFEALKQHVDSLKVENFATYEMRNTNTEYESNDHGFVMTTVSTREPQRIAQAFGMQCVVEVKEKIKAEERCDEKNGKMVWRTIAGTMANDSSDERTPSISTTSFMMPVPKDTAWKVKTPDDATGKTIVAWLSLKSTLISPEKSN